MIIYKITNTLNNKEYIGQTTKPLKQRWREHQLAKKRQAIHYAIKKYGVENFKIEQIGAATNQDELNQLEYDLIIQHNTMAPFGYNLRAGGMQCGISEETRQKKIDWYKTHKNPQLGKKLTEEHRKKVSMALKGHVVSEETRNKISLANKGKIISQTHRDIVSKNNQTREVTDLTRQRLSTSHIGKASAWTKGNSNVKGRVYYHNPTTNVVIMIKPEAQPPEGFVRGRGFCANKIDTTHPNHKKNRENTKDRKWWHNPETKIQKRLLPTDPIPEGFVIGKMI